MGLLNYETILSSYDDKLTLMQWLKKVEAALNNAAAVAFNVNKRGDATLTFSIVFEDGSELESGPIVLQQGESVESAAIVGGHLLLTLTNGDVLDAGELLNGDLNVTGNVTATGNISATGNVSAAGLEATGTGVETDIITASGASLDIFAPVVNLNNGLAAQGGISSEDEISTPVITSDETEIEARKPIVELMAGYGFYSGSVANFTRNFVYVGACKNGNKLTCVVAGKYTPLTGVSNNISLCEIIIPSAVLARIYPVVIAGTPRVDFSRVLFVKDGNNMIELPCFVTKTTNSLVFNAGGISNLTINDEYYARYEITILLSENLAA